VLQRNRMQHAAQNSPARPAAHAGVPLGRALAAAMVAGAPPPAAGAPCGACGCAAALAASTECRNAFMAARSTCAHRAGAEVSPSE